MSLENISTRTIESQELAARRIATELHQMHCHAGDGENCTWDYETWDIAEKEMVILPFRADTGDDASGTVRTKYLTKAHKLLKYFNGPDELHRCLKCLRTVSPKIACQLIEEL